MLGLKLKVLMKFDTEDPSLVILLLVDLVTGETKSTSSLKTLSEVWQKVILSKDLQILKKYVSHIRQL